MKLEYSLTPYTKISPKWIKDLNVSLGIIKLLEESIGRTLFGLYHRNNFLDPPPRAMTIFLKIWTELNSKAFTHKGNQRQPTEWDKKVANDATNKGYSPKA